MDVDPVREAAKRFYELLLQHHVLARDPVIARLTKENAEMREAFSDIIFTCPQCNQLRNTKDANYGGHILVNGCACNTVTLCSECWGKSSYATRKLPRCRKGHPVCPKHNSAELQCDYCDTKFQICVACTPSKCISCERIAHSVMHINSTGNCHECQAQFDRLQESLKKRKNI